MKKNVVISLFDKTGNAVKPWADKGFKCYCVDIAHEKTHTKDNIRFVKADLLSWVPPRKIVNRVVFVFAFPPCDHLAVSGARWFKGKGLNKLSQSIDLFERATFWCEWFGAPYLIENPVSTISSYWRKSDFIFNPYEYAGYCKDDYYIKKTCLWVGGGFVMPKKKFNPKIKPDNRIHLMAPSQDRKDKRSATPMGFAKAVYLANKKRWVS